MRNLEELFSALDRSTFRKKFRLQNKDMEYLHSKGMQTILNHAEDFINKRLSSAYPTNDGKQTPFKGHPVFVAQHATACCCRGCLAKWHNIPQGRPLYDNEKIYIRTVLQRWLDKELRDSELNNKR